jgi:uncharacterized phage protein (TIGR01671 family)
MKREIKFRAWDISKKRWLTDFDTAYLSDEGTCSILKSTNYNGDYLDSQTAEINMFTGQKDKNGKEIYEGDFDEDMQVAMWCENSCGWQWATYDFPTKEKICCHCYNCEGDYNFTEQIEKVEIHGNIYENAEVQTS